MKWTKEYLPKSTFATTPSSLDAETRKRFKSSRTLDDFQRPGTVYEQFYIVAIFCRMKCVIFREIGDLDHCKMWLDLPLMIFQDLLEEHNGVDTKGQLISKCPFGVIFWTKIPPKNLTNSALPILGQKLSNFSLIFCSKR